MVWNIKTVDDAVYYVKYTLEHNKDILNQYNYFNYEAFISIFDEMGPNNTDFRIESGASKGVLIPQNEKLNFVIKIPFQENFSIDEMYSWGDYNSYSQICEPNEPFIHAKVFIDNKWEGSDNYDDYCYCEALITDEARKAGVANFIAQTEIYDEALVDFQTIPIYVSERAEESFDCAKSSKKTKRMTKDEKETITNTVYSHNSSIPIQWCFEAVEYYGINMVDSFLNFVDEHRLNDFHSGNLGYIEGRPIIIDYSGFND